jgi:hypothetical protein
MVLINRHFAISPVEKGRQLYVIGSAPRARRVSSLGAVEALAWQAKRIIDRFALYRDHGGLGIALKGDRVIPVYPFWGS